MSNALVSKCLLGEKCRWDGNLLQRNVLRNAGEYRLLPICPDMDGGLPCPRPAAEINSGDGFSVLDGKSRVVDSFDRDVTDNLLRGAQKALNLALMKGIEIAFLKEKSPSCGVGQIYISGDLTSGIGVTAALLTRHGIKLEPVE